MSSLYIDKVEIEAFKCFTKRVVLNLEELGVGLHFIRGVNKLNPRLGANGAGKSSLWDAVCWCLYGQTVGGLKTTDVRSWRVDKPPRVAVTLTEYDSEGQGRVVIERQSKASGITINGEVVGQDEVNDLIGLDYALFTQAVILGQGRPLFFDLPPRDKMQLFADVLGLEKWEGRAAGASKRVSDLKRTLEGVEGELIGIENAVEHAESALKDSKERGSAWDKERSQRTSELEKRLSEAEDRTKSLETKHDEASLAADDAGTKLRLDRPAVEELRQKLWADKDAIRDAEVEVTHERRSIEKMTNEIVKLKETETCPMCGQEIKKTDIQKHINKLMTERNKAIERADQTDRRAKDDKAQAVTLAENLETAQTRLEKLEEIEGKQMVELKIISGDLGEARGKLNSLATNLAELQEGTNPHREAVTSARARFKQVKKELNALCDKADKIEVEIERTNFWAKGFRAIRLMVIEDVLADLQETTAELMEDMGLGDWEVRYAAEKETKAGTKQHALTVEVVSPESGEPAKWEVWSGGEGQRLRLAGALALSEVLLAHAGMEISLRVLDEPTRGLSTEGVRDLCELLASYAEDTGLQLYYVDHTATESTHFTSVTTVVNESNGARIN